LFIKVAEQKPAGVEARMVWKLVNLPVELFRQAFAEGILAADMPRAEKPKC